ncbi:MAG: hypothetical protein IH594_00850 [Bacteroidales bacterium]|nr:hypothetical protein [Bacteroidales bacterium]
MINENIPQRRSTISPIRPTMTDPNAPPVLAANSIPERDPWCFFTEFIAIANISGHITECENPKRRNPEMEKLLVPKVAKQRLMMAAIVKPRSIFRLSKNFNKIIPRPQPNVSSNQYPDNTFAPVVCGLMEWKFDKNCVSQLPFPCSHAA